MFNLLKHFCKTFNFFLISFCLFSLCLRNMSKYQYQVTKFSSSERKWFEMTLQQSPWNKRSIRGPRRNLKKRCVVVDSNSSIPNKFYDRLQKGQYKGPPMVTPYQAQFIVVKGYLPFNEPKTPKMDQWELSHIGGNKKCINVEGGHVHVQKHRDNLIRIDHHRELTALRESKMKQRRDQMRSTGSNRGCSVIYTLTAKLDYPKCKCKPRCFKNFVKSDL